MDRVCTLLLLLALCANPVAGMWTCSRGAKEHDWVAFNDYTTKADAEFLAQAARELARQPYGEKAHQCHMLSLGMTIGFHEDHGPMNGVDNDDHIMRRAGCPSPIYIPVTDRHARLSAMIACAIYSKREYREYGIEWFTTTFLALGRLGSSSNRNNDCRSARTYTEITSRTRLTYQLCWNFVRDVRDLSCNLRLYRETPAGSSRTDAKRYKQLIKTPSGTREMIFSSDPDMETLFGVVFDPMTLMPSDLVPKYLVAVDDVADDICSVEFGKANYYRFSYEPDAASKEAIASRKSAKALKAGFDGPAADKVTAAPIYRIKDNAATGAVHIEGLTDGVCFGNSEDYDDPSKHCAPDYSHDRSARRDAKALMVQDRYTADKPKGVPFMGLNEVPTDESAANRGASASSGSWGKVSGMSTVVSIGASYHSLHYSRNSLMNSASWLENKLGNVGSLLAAPLKLLAATAEAMQFVAARAIVKIARSSGLCPEDMSEADCVCGVVAPLMEAVADIFRTPPPLEGENKAITFLASYTAGGHISALGKYTTSGVYITFHWVLDDQTNIGFDVGSFSGSGTMVSAGTDVVSLGFTKRIKLSLFFGLATEISAWTKGIDVGIDIGLSGKIGFELLFRTDYIDLNYVERCKPIDYTFGAMADGTTKTIINGAGRFLLLPVNPVCVRGFSVSIFLGTGVGKVVNANMFTAMETIKYASIVQWQNIEDDERRKFSFDKGALKETLVTAALTGAGVVATEVPEVRSVLSDATGASSSSSGVMHSVSHALGSVASTASTAISVVQTSSEVLNKIQGVISAAQIARADAAAAEAAAIAAMSEEQRRLREEQQRAEAARRLADERAEEAALEAERKKKQAEDALLSWARRAELASKEAWIIIPAADQSGFIGSITSKRYLVVEHHWLKLYSGAVPVKDKGWTAAGSPDIVINLNGAALTFPSTLAHMTADVLATGENAWFQVRGKGEDGSTVVTGKFIVTNPKKYMSWLEILHNKISVFRAKIVVGDDFFRSYERFRISKTMLNTEIMIDANVADAMQNIPNFGKLDTEDASKLEVEDESLLSASSSSSTVVGHMGSSTHLGVTGSGTVIAQKLSERLAHSARHGAHSLFQSLQQVEADLERLA